MLKQPAFMFYTGDWIKDTKPLSLASKGAWIDLLCSMWHSQTRGMLSLTWLGYSRLIGATVEQTKSSIGELVDLGICDCILGGDKTKNIEKIVTCNLKVTLVNRRMFKNELNREKTRLRVKKHRIKMKGNDECNTNETLHSSYSFSNSISKTHKAGKMSLKDCPHKEIINLYHEILPELTHILEWKGQRMKNLAQRWKESKERQNLEWWKAFFEKVKTSPFLMGKKTDFHADLRWLVKYENFIKVLEGNYDEKRSKTMKIPKQIIKEKEKHFSSMDCLNCKHHITLIKGRNMSKCNHPVTEKGKEKAMNLLKIIFVKFKSEEFFKWPDKFSINWLINCDGFEK